MKLLSQCATPHGPLAVSVKDKLEAYIKRKFNTTDQWGDICHSMVSGTGRTLWQIVCEMDPSFPRVGRGYDKDNNISRDWIRIPSGFDVAAAIEWHFRLDKKSKVA